MRLKRFNWAPYLLILPSFLYLMVFFGWPMVRAMELAFKRDSQILQLREEPDGDSSVIGRMETGTITNVEQVLDESAGSTGGFFGGAGKTWIQVSAENLEGELVQGWATRGELQVGDVKVSAVGTIAGDTASVRAEPDDASDAVGELPAGAEIQVLSWDGLREINLEDEWTQVETGRFPNTKKGWVPTEAITLEEEFTGVTATATVMHENPDSESKVVQELAEATALSILLGERKSIPVWLEITTEDESVRGWVRTDSVELSDKVVSATGRVVSGSGAKEWTLDYVKRMFRHSQFQDALWTTLLLIVLILPIQFTLAITMALVLQSRLKGNTTFLYIYSIPLGISDLAAGLVWYSIFTQRGFLNTVLQQLHLIDGPVTFIGPDSRQWIILAIVLAEVWRATSIVMVIVVSGLQAIPGELLEAGELFGANMWQRLRHVILPLLKPSLQVALILRTILAFQVFAVVVAIAGNVPEVITVLSNETYRWYSVGAYNNPNVAAAYAGFIMVISLGIAVFYLRAVRSQEEEVAKKK